jgi:hypothetical protein
MPYSRFVLDHQMCQRFAESSKTTALQYFIFNHSLTYVRQLDMTTPPHKNG